VGFSGKVYFCPFIRVEVGDLATSSLEEIWNGPTYVEMRRRLVEQARAGTLQVDEVLDTTHVTLVI
jgi:hypothetical protein